MGSILLYLLHNPPPSTYSTGRSIDYLRSKGIVSKQNQKIIYFTKKEFKLPIKNNNHDISKYG